MRTSYNFEEYRDSVAETLRKKKEQEGLTAANELLAQEKLDIRYEISHELRRLERLLAVQEKTNEGQVEQESLPENWERIDIADKMPDWLKLLVDAVRVQRLGRELEERELGTRTFDKHLPGRIAAIYFPDEMLQRIRGELLEEHKDLYTNNPEALEKESAEILAYAQRDFIGFFSKHPEKQLRCLYPRSFIADPTHSRGIFPRKVVDFIDDVSGGLYLQYEQGEARRPDCLESGNISDGIVRAYIHSVGGWAHKYSKNYIVDHTLSNESALFDINTPILWQQVWVASSGLGYNYQYLDKPLIFFTLDNPAFRKLNGFSEDARYMPAVGEGFMRFEHNKNYQSALNDGLISTRKPTWADLSDTVVDLVKGEVLKHRYPEEKNPRENSE